MVIVFASVSAAGEEVDISKGIFPGTELKKVEPIRINNNAELASYASAGSGTIGDPYLIENLEIDATGYGAAIYVGNTTSYFKVQNCSLSFADRLSWPYHLGAGLILYNVANAAVMNNNLTSNHDYGVYVYGAHGTVLTGNLCEGSAQGVSLLYSDDCQIFSNELRGNGYAGLFLQNSNHNYIGENDLSSNTDYDIYVSAYTGLTSSNNYIYGNRCNDTPVSICLDNAQRNIVQANRGTGNNIGLFLYHADNNSIEINEFSGASRGIYLQMSYDNTVLSNHCDGYQDGVHLYESGRNNISRNDLVGGIQGVNLQDSSGNELFENTCSENVYGIYLLRSDGNNITGNECWNNDNGVYLQLSNGCAVWGNHLHDNKYVGLFVDQSNGSTVFENKVQTNGMFGVYVVGGSSGNQLLNNTLFNNTAGVQLEFSNGNQINGNEISGTLVENGIVLVSSSGNGVRYNTCVGYAENGILLDGSDDNTLAYNKCSEGLRGIYLTGSSDNIIDHNTCSDNRYGIYIHNSDSNDVTWIVCIDSLETGISVLSSYDVLVSRNECYNSAKDGIYLEDTNFTRVGQNICIGGTNGIHLNRTYDTYVTSNECSELTENGILLDLALVNYISNNECTLSPVGIFLRSSWGSSVLFNIVDHCGTGLRLDDSTFNTLQANDCSNNTGQGIFLQQSNNNTLDSNLLSHEPVGLMLLSSQDNDIYGNTVTLCGAYGMVLDHSDNNSVENNTCRESQTGIMLLESSWNMIRSNDCWDNIDNGILLTSSAHNDIIDNLCGSQDFGIYLDGSNENTLKDNDCSGNDYYGMYLSFSNNNTISGNECNSSMNGIYLSYSNDNTISDNFANSNSEFGGIVLQYSDRNTLADNTCQHNPVGYGAILLVFSSWNIIIDNECHDSGYGVFLQSYCDNNTISGNNLSNNLKGGVYLWRYCDRNIVIGNECNDNPLEGIYLNMYCENNTVSDNILNGNGRGVYLFDSNDTILSNNACNGNSQYGVGVIRSPRSMVEDNNCSGNGITGIYVISSRDCVITRNILLENAVYGVHFFDAASSNNLVYDNILIGNHGSSSVYNSSLVQASDAGTNQWSSGVRGNLWGDWTSPDVNGDGIVDQPYLIGGGVSQDEFPIALSVVIRVPASVSYTNGSISLVAGSAYFAIGLSSIAWRNTANGGTGSCDGTSAWSCHVPLIEGANIITVTMVDVIGLVRQASVTLVMDTVAPTISIDSPEDGSGQSSDVVMVNWTGNDGGSGIAYYLVGMDDGTPINTTALSHIFTGVADGEHLVTVKAYDMAGNSADDAVRFTVDTDPPVLQIVRPDASEVLGQKDVTFNWTCSDMTSGIDHINVSLDGGTPVQLLANATSYTFYGLAEGEHSVNVTAVDQIGNVAWAERSFLVDTVAPSLTVLSPAEGAYISVNVTVVEWEAIDTGSGIAKMEVSFDGANWTTVVDSNYTTPQLDEGLITAQVRITDQAGNSVLATRNITVDTIAPTAAVSPTGDQVSLSPLIAIEFSEAMNQTSVTIVVDGVEGSVDWSGNTATLTLSGRLAYGTTYNVTASGKDLAGNSMEINWTFSTLAVGSIQGVLLDGNGDPMAGIVVQIIGGENTTTDAQGSFRFDQIIVGNYTLTVEANGYEPLSMNVTVEADGTTDLGDLTLVSTDAGSDEAPFPWLILIIGLVIVAAVAVVAVVYLKKK